MTKHSPLRIAFQMDPMEAVDINGDTTFALAEVAAQRGMSLFEYGPQHLVYNHGRIQAYARPMTVRREKRNHVSFESRRLIDLVDDIDVVWMRQDPPFDMAYITAAHILERLKGQTLVANDPEWVRSGPEKILPLDYPHLMPETLITRDETAIRAFRDTHKDIIIKPLYGNGGAGVFRMKEGDSNFASLLEMFFSVSREPIIAQAFLKDVSKGDKRIIIIDGTPVGAINRVPQPGETRSNMHVGGEARATDLTETDMIICDAIGPMLKERGQILVGIDVIGDKMTEINTTSPTGVQELKRFTGIDAAALSWDAIERRLNAN
ncbi:glutathione synthase [Litorimonas taeanensis]|uniref:Glutathione synthetase n=1 Tax=Litorimonas taeanensis TaxID=568099 RepID=A0A420WDF8_9PROT|nr:glutathione synthase [Litorimonas taeanensis]RKQ69018.1 glutathione synthase [Litorimonas taeanensis]